MARGKELYAKSCASCHGPSGKGDGPKGQDLRPKPSDLSASTVVGQSEGELYWKVTTGRRPMPAFRKDLTDEDRWHVVHYVRSLGSTSQPAAH